MRVLFLSNYYPPFGLGGYEQWCQEVAESLVERGHEVVVLTASVKGEPVSDLKSTSATASTATVHGPTVLRQLHLELEGGLWQTMVRLGMERRRLEKENIESVTRVIEEFQPDAALIWGMWNVPRSVPATVEALLFGRVAYYICDYWLSLPTAYIQRWQEDARRGFAQIFKQVLSIPFMAKLQKDAPIGLAVENPICVSKAVRDLLMKDGVPVGHAQILYGGTQIETFVDAARLHREERRVPHDNSDLRTLRLVTAARLVADKGVHTTLQALGRLRQTDPKFFESPSLQLDIYGQGDEHYVAYLQTLVDEHDLGNVVSFCGSVPRADMPEILAQYDAFLFSSEWEEPFARSVLEAMAAGLLVIGTTTGGSGEILVENETGLTYRAGDADSLAAQLNRVLSDRSLIAYLSDRGQRHVVANHTFEQMVDGLERAMVRIGHVSTPLLRSGHDVKPSHLTDAVTSVASGQAQPDHQKSFIKLAT